MQGATALIDFLLTNKSTSRSTSRSPSPRRSKPASRLKPIGCKTSRRIFACGRLLFVIRKARPVTLTRLYGLNTIAGRLIPFLREV